MMGNNPFMGKRSERARNPEEARRQVEWLNVKKVKSSAGKGNPITLGRIAKAFAPVLIALRDKAKDHLRKQVESSTPIEQADLALLGYEGTKLCGQSRDYVERFGILITKVSMRNTSEEEIRRRNEGFAKIARDGLERDALLKGMLNDAIPGDIDSACHLLLHGKPKMPVKSGATGATSGSKT